MTTTAAITTRGGETDHGVVIENQWYDDWIENHTNSSQLKGKVAIITGSNSGTGFWTASALAGMGCTVILACRSLKKAEYAKQEIMERYPHNAHVDASLVIDNMDLNSVRVFAKAFKSKYDRLDFLLNNAGIMAQPTIKSKDGFDIQFQTNHLAHFLLTKLLYSTMMSTSDKSRIIQHSSGAHRIGSPIFTPTTAGIENPTHNWGWFGMNVFVMRGVLAYGGNMRPTDRWLRYGVSKLCNILFMKLLANKIEQKSNLSEKIISVACHPGYANTNLQNAAGDAFVGWQENNRKHAQSAADGSLPLIMACISNDIENGDYVGPEKFLSGEPKVGVSVGGNGGDMEMATKLWEYSETCLEEKFQV